MAAAGLSDGHVGHTRSVVIEFARSLSGPLWSATCDDADRFLAEQRRAGRSVTTRAGKAGALALFFEFVISRYQGDIHALTGFVVEPADRRVQPAVRAPRWARCGCRPRRARSTSCSPSGALSVPSARKYLPAARDYFAASLWRRLGLRINETVMLDIRDWRPDLGGFGKLHVRTARAAGAGARRAGWSRRSTARTG